MNDRLRSEMLKSISMVKRSFNSPVYRHWLVMINSFIVNIYRMHMILELQLLETYYTNFFLVMIYFIFYGFVVIIMILLN